MKSKLLILFFFLAIASIQIVGQSSDIKNISNESITDYTKYVDPMIGTDWNGHTFPGPVLPFGMIQLGPDTGSDGWDIISEYHYDNTSILDFSHIRLSGSGAGVGGYFI